MVWPVELKGKTCTVNTFRRYCFYCRLYRQLLSSFPQIPCGVVVALDCVCVVSTIDLVSIYISPFIRVPKRYHSMWLVVCARFCCEQQFIQLLFFSLFFVRTFVLSLLNSKTYYECTMIFLIVLWWKETKNDTHKDITKNELGERFKWIQSAMSVSTIFIRIVILICQNVCVKLWLAVLVKP